jgi:hypothetical protein
MASLIEHGYTIFQSEDFTKDSREARIQVKFKRPHRKAPIVCASLAETNLGPWGWFLLCNNITAKQFTMAARVADPSCPITPGQQGFVKVNWIVVSE